MADHPEPRLAANACMPCKQHKRKCNKALPKCGTCDRVGRLCTYADRPKESTEATEAAVGTVRSPFSIPSMITVDPYSHQTLRQPFINIAVRDEAFNILGELPEVEEMVLSYFSTTSIRMPIVSQIRILRELPQTYSIPRADFSLLCLSMYLVQQKPRKLDSLNGSLQSSLYVTLKCLIASLEAANYLSLDFVQARALVCFYELGHAIYPAASASVASCARTARALGLEAKSFQAADRDYSNLDFRLAAEEEKRTWWAVVNLDRFINFCTGDSVLSTCEPSSSDILPIEDTKWSRGEYPEEDVNTLNLSTSHHVQAGPFARECQILYLVGRVIRHVFDPSSDANFQKQEGRQLARTFNAYLPLLMVEEENYGSYCAAFGLCCSALFVMYDAAIQSGLYSEDEQNELFASIEDIANRFSRFGQQVYANPVGPEANVDQYSPFACYCIYQAITVQQRLRQRFNSPSSNMASETLRSVLSKFQQRWLVASLYIKQLDVSDPWAVDAPTTIHFICQGRSMSANGPASNVPFPCPS